MPSDEEASQVDASEFESQFVPKSNDEEELYEVLEITAERGNKYRVRWAGKDPATGKPWPLDWVPKSDCTPDLVKGWKEKKANKKKPATKRRGGRASLKSRVSTSKVSTPSTSRRTQSVTGAEPPKSESDADEVPHTGPSSRKPPSTKRKRISVEPSHNASSDNADSPELQEGRLKKKRKLVDVLVPPLSSDSDGEPILPAKSTKLDMTPPREQDEDEEAEAEPTLPPVPITKVGPPRGVKRNSRDSKQSRESIASKADRPSTSSRPTPTSPHSNAAKITSSRSGTKLKAGSSDALLKTDSLTAEKLQRSKEKPPVLNGPKSANNPPSKSKARAQPVRRSPSIISIDSTPTPTHQPRQHSPVPLPGRRSPILSPRAKARLELFDRMMAEEDSRDPSRASQLQLPPQESAGAVDHYEFNQAGDDMNYDFGNEPEPEPIPEPDTAKFVARKSPPTLLSPSSRLTRPLPAVRAAVTASHDPGIVPETDSSNNNTDQSQSQSQPSHPLVQPSESRRRSHSPVVPGIAITASSSPSVGGGVKQTTSTAKHPSPSKPSPDSSSYFDRMLSKPQKPIPQISPATFRAKVAPLQVRRVAKAMEFEDDAPMSSIESFPSPSLRKNKGKRRVEDVEDDEPGSGSSDGDHSKKIGVTDSAIRKRGTALYDQALRSKEKGKGKEKPTKKPLADLLPSRKAQADKDKSGKGKEREGVVVAAKEMDDTYVDFCGGGNSATIDTTGSADGIVEDKLKRVLELREEEEESTQDLLLEQKLLSGAESRDQAIAAGEEVVMGDPQELPVFSANEDTIDHPSTHADQDGELQLASIIVHPSQGQGQHAEDVIEAQQAFVTPPSSPPRSNPGARTRRLSDALSLLNLKSEEIQRLGRELAEEQEKRAKLEQELATATLKAVVDSTSASAQTGNHVHPDTTELAKTRAQLEAKKAAWHTESTEWNAERATERADRDAERASWARERRLLEAKRKDAEVAAQREREMFEAERDVWDAERARWPLQLAKIQTERASIAQQLEVRAEECEKLNEQASHLRRDEVAWDKERNQREAERLIWDVERATWLQEREEQAAWKAQLAAWENERAAVDKERADWVTERGLLQSKVAALEGDRAQWGAESASREVEHTQWDADRAKLVEQLETATTSLATLTSSVDLLTRGKLSAEKDRELFREKYAEASEYAMTVRRENIELEERANIAESQAKDGVAMVKGMFESQVKMLKNDVARWKGIAELMQEKDRLTGDDIRRRAAEEPELRERCHWLVDNFNSLEADFRQMGNTQLKLVTERNKLEKKVLKLQTERNALRSKLENASLQDANGIIDDVHAMNGASSESDASGISDVDGIEVGDLDDDDEDEDDDYAWFPCKWRPDGPDQCGYTFDCVEDLERHILGHAGHLGVSVS